MAFFFLYSAMECARGPQCIRCSTTTLYSVCVWLRVYVCVCVWAITTFHKSPRIDFLSPFFLLLLFLFLSPMIMLANGNGSWCWCRCREHVILVQCTTNGESVNVIQYRNLPPFNDQFSHTPAQYMWSTSHAYSHTPARTLAIHHTRCRRCLQFLARASVCVTEYCMCVEPLASMCCTGTGRLDSAEI